MKIVRFTVNHSSPQYGIQENGKIRAITGELKDITENNYSASPKEYSQEEAAILPPCTPSKILCLGLNYQSHAKELELPIPSDPILFMKPSTALVGPGKAIHYPPHSKRVDYEAELGVVIGKTCYRVKKEKTLNYVIGYTCANDVTARDHQPKEGQWTYAKSFDTFAPIGPCIETEISDPENLKLAGYLNSTEVQQGNTRDHIFPIKELLEHISHCMTLLPGDVIMTGTPSGIGPMQPGDSFEVKIEGIGNLYNPVEKMHQL